MEGPTPVSALIHAATMVTAGVYLIVRTHPLFELAPNVQDLAAGLGAATLLDGRADRARPDRHQARDRVLDDVADRLHVPRAPGSARTRTAMFHLMTHAFFKALLFLAAGIVIHALAGEQDMRQDGRPAAADAEDVRRRCWSARSRWSGIPPFAGFFSKDSILARRAREAAWYGAHAVRGRPGRRVPDRPLHVPDALHRLRRRAVGLRARAPATRDTATGGAGVDGLPVAALAVLAAGRRAGSSSQGVWEPARSTSSSRSREPLVEATGTQEADRERARGRPRRWPGSGVAWCDLLGPGDGRGAAGCGASLEHKFYFDERTTTRSSTGRAGLAHGLYAAVEGPLIAGSMRGRRTASRAGSGARRRRAPDGPRPHLRARARERASPSSSSSSWWCAERADDAPDLPADRRGALLWLLPLPLATAASLGFAGGARRGRVLDRRRAAVRLRAAAASSSSADTRVVERPRRLLPRRHVRLLALARRAGGRREARPRSPTGSGPGRERARARTSG